MLILMPSANNDLYAPRRENYDEMQRSAFYSCYVNAECCVDEIINQSNKDSAFECSNIIAFTGDRGSGKTSTMMNFAQILEDHKKL